MPGRSVTFVSGCPLMDPSLRSTVTPGKLPTCWFDPVSWLKRVVLPQFWLPASAKVRVVPSGIAGSLAWPARTWRMPPSPMPGWVTGCEGGEVVCDPVALRSADVSFRMETSSASATRSVRE